MSTVISNPGVLEIQRKVFLGNFGITKNKKSLYLLAGMALLATSVAVGSVLFASSYKTTAHTTPVAAAAVAPYSSNFPQQVTIANNGLLFIRGARVLSVSGNTLTITMNWNTSTITWTVPISSNTSFYRKSGEKITIADLQPGDTVEVTGTIAGDSNRLAVDAQSVSVLNN